MASLTTEEQLVVVERAVDALPLGDSRARQSGPTSECAARVGTGALQRRYGQGACLFAP
jgi:hypothetical protein